MRRRLSKNSKIPEIPKPVDDENNNEKKDINQPPKTPKTSPKKRIRSTKNNQSKKSPKKARLVSTNQENNPPGRLGDKIDHEEVQPLKIINLQNLKQQTLFAYFKKL